MNERTRWDEERQARSREDSSRRQQGGWEGSSQSRQQENWSGQQGGWNDDYRSGSRSRGNYGASYGDPSYGRERQPKQREWRGAGQQGGSGGGTGWSARDSDIGARGTDRWDRRDDARVPGSQSFAADYGMRGGGANYDETARRTGYGGAGTPGFGRGYGPDYGRDADDGAGTGERGFFARAGDEIASWFGDDDATRRREADYRGHGPADYTRSDERIREDANDRLTDDPRVDARKISVAVDKGEVTLSGTVSNREAKRRAEDCVDRISAVKHVQNNLRVEQSSWSTAAAGNTGISSTAATNTTGTSGLTAGSTSTPASSATTSGSKQT